MRVPKTLVADVADVADVANVVLATFEAEVASTRSARTGRESGPAVLGSAVTTRTAHTSDVRVTGVTIA